MTDEPPPKPPDKPPTEATPAESPDLGSAGGVPIPGHFPYPPGTPGGTVVGVQQAVQIWQSPYPPPEAIERYEKICPGTFDRMLGMAERLQAAQIKQTETSNQFIQNDTRRGQWLGFAVAMAALIAAIVVVLIGNPWVASLCLSVPVMAIAKALIDSVKAK
jgi:uncharacterized membrane protein